MTIRKHLIRTFFLVMLVSLILAACDGSSPIGTGGPGTTTGAPETTSAPETTAAPDPTEAPPATEAPDTTTAEGDGEGISTEGILLILGILVAFLLIGWLMGRSRKDTPAPVAAPITWRDHTREGYSEARWLHDGMTEELAIWRGNSLRSPEEGQQSSALSDRWEQIDSRMTAATGPLYRAEASASDQATSAAIGLVVTSLNDARAAVDARAEARFNAAGVDPSDEYAAAQAAEQERLAGGRLAEAREKLSQALRAVNELL